jgi:hypothetical protein
MSPVFAWPDSADEVMASDQVVAFAYVTPAAGVVVTPLTNFGLRDRSRGTLTPVNTSVGTWKKLERIRRNPKVALAYHTREHGFTGRPEYVLVQGRAELSPPHPDYPHSIAESWERFAGSPDYGPAWGSWLRVWRRRVAITVKVERVLVWSDRRCIGEPEVHGAPQPDHPSPQRPPHRGTGSRIDHRRAAARASRLSNVLLGWVGGDGFPFIVPVAVSDVTHDGIQLDPPPGLVAPGGRRAGLTAHSFARYTVGQQLRKHTGWMTAEPDEQRILYAPHTETGYRLPESEPLFKLVAGGVTWLGLRGSRRAGFAN